MFIGVSGHQLTEIVHTVRREEKCGPWERLLTPVDGCLVGLSSHKAFHHVGIYLAVDGGSVLHACDGKGVLLQGIHNLKQHGWNRVEYFVHNA